MKRTFIYTDDKSDKFWSIDINGAGFTVTYGKVGANGQTSTKSFTDEAACQKEANKLIAEKIKKGYIEDSSDNASRPVGNEADTPPPPIEILTKEEAQNKFNFWKEKKLHDFAGDYIFYCKGNLTLEKCRLDWIQSEGMEFIETDDKEACAGLIIDGNLTVKTCVKNGEIDFGQVLYVSGDLLTKNVMLGGAEVYVEGNLIAEEIVWTTYNHGYLTVGKDLTAKLAIFEDHYTSVKGKVNVLAVIDDNSHGDVEVANSVWDFSTVLVKSVLEENEYYEEPEEGEDPADYEPPYQIDGGKLYTALEEGKKVLKPIKKNKSVAKGFDVMKCIEASIAKAKGKPLSELSFRYEKLRELPVEIFSMKELQSLQSLDLEGTLITKLPAEIKQFANLEELDLAETNITALPEEIGQLKKLTKLSLNGCKLKTLSASFSQLENLEELEMADVLAYLDQFPDLSKFQKLKTLDLSMKNASDSLTKEQLDAIFSLKLPLLEELDLEDCSLKDAAKYDMPPTISNFKELRELDITGCSLKSIPDEIKKLKNLEELELYGNYLSQTNIERLQKLLPDTDISGADDQIIFPDAHEFTILKTKTGVLLNNANASTEDFITAGKLLDQAHSLLRKRFDEGNLGNKDMEKLNSYLYSFLAEKIEYKRMETRFFYKKNTSEHISYCAELLEVSQNCLKQYTQKSGNPTTEENRIWMLTRANFGVASYYYYSGKSRGEVEKGLSYLNQMVETAGDGRYKDWAKNTRKNVIDAINSRQY